MSFTILPFRLMTCHSVRSATSCRSAHTCVRSPPHPALLSRAKECNGIMRRGVRGARKKPDLTPGETDLPFYTEKGFRSLLKPLAFTCVVGVGSFAGASVWQYEYILHHFQHTMHNTKAHMEDRFYGKAGSLRNKLNSWWNDLSAGRKTVACLIGMNVGVFALWKVPGLRMFMYRNFTSSPMSDTACRTMVSSTFSHFSLFHLAANMYVFWSFSDIITRALGREQFLAFFLTAGVVSNFASYVNKVRVRGMRPSLGASGAIMAVLGYVCYQFPDVQLSVAFVGEIIPHSFSASAAMKTLVIFDSLGVLLRWRFFDHAAHLGGMLFGILYARYGKDVWQGREAGLRWYHEMRGKPTAGR